MENKYIDLANLYKKELVTIKESSFSIIDPHI